MSRERTGSKPSWDEKTKRWRGRITVIGGRPWLLAPEGLPNNARGFERAVEWFRERSDIAKSEKMTIEDFQVVRRRVAPAAPAPTAAKAEKIIVSRWYGDYYDWREKRPVGGETVSDSRGRFKKWIEPKLGPLEMEAVTRDDLERFAEYLDEQVAEEVIAPKTALNIWGEITAGFAVAKLGKNRFGKNLDLRILDRNPAETAAGPDGGTDKQKPFLRPDEVVRLLSCEGPKGVPLERRHVYAVAIYTAARQAELRGLRVGDIDLDAMQITVARQLKGGKEKDRTKGGRARIIQIEPNLAPLLRVLVEDRDKEERLLSVRAHNRCASHLREDLLLAKCSREALHVPKNDPMRARMKFHNLRDTCGTHMAMRRDPPQDVQWRLGHTSPVMTERYIMEARYQAGKNFGEPLPPLPECLLRKDDGPEPGGDDSSAEGENDSDKPSRSSTVRGDTSHEVDRAEATSTTIPAEDAEYSRLRFPAPPPSNYF